MRCVEDSRSHRSAVAHGWTWCARGEFEGPAATQRAILLTRTLNDRPEHWGGAGRLGMPTICVGYRCSAAAGVPKQQPMWAMITVIVGWPVMSAWRMAARSE
jgi:hypothetical protein